MQYEKSKHKIHKHKHKWIYAQWFGSSETKANEKKCKNCSSKCADDCALLEYYFDNLLSYLQTTIIAQMLSVWGEGVPGRLAADTFCG